MKDEGVAEVFGTMLLLLIAVSLFSVVSFIVFAEVETHPDYNDKTIYKYLDIESNNNTTRFHLGGESVPVTELDGWSGDDLLDGFFDIGETIMVNKK